MKRNNKITKWEYPVRIRKKYPRNFVKQYPEGVLRESMRGVYWSHHLLLADHDFPHPMPFYWFNHRRMQRWLSSNLGEEVDILFSKFVKMAGPRIDKMKYWKNDFVYYPGESDSYWPCFTVDSSNRLELRDFESL